MGQTETACEGGVRKRRAVKAGGGEREGGWVGSGRVRGKKGGQGVEVSGNAMGSLPGMKYVGIDLFKA